ncbi:hypothetical protein Leryth_010799 [Lithospermum erythrorhizon]|nr:hypothetical protein Leryth_010799 [Lithospermum erythrorhizon]
MALYFEKGCYWSSFNRNQLNALVFAGSLIYNSDGGSQDRLSGSLFEEPLFHNMNGTSQMIASDIREGKGDRITSLSGDRGGPVLAVTDYICFWWFYYPKVVHRQKRFTPQDDDLILVDKPDLHSSGIHQCIPKRPENFLLKLPPVPQASSSQEALRDMISDSVIRRKNRMNVPTSEGAKHDIEVAEGNLPSGASVNKELQFRRTASYSDADVSETTFNDMLKSNTN